MTLRKYLLLVQIVGYILHFMLFGVLSLQVCKSKREFHLKTRHDSHALDIYSSAFPNDVLINKVFVYAVYLLEVTQSIMMSYTAFQVFAIGYGHASGYDDVGVTWFSIPLISGLGMSYQSVLFGVCSKMDEVH